MDKRKSPIYGALEELQLHGKYPFHMPGHKRQKQRIFPDSIFSYDITEITDYDNLHYPDGIIKESMDYAKKVYGSKMSFPLINSSTGGILAGISAMCSLGDTILVARNCHQSVYHSIHLLGLRPVYIFPRIEEDRCLGIGANEVRDALSQHPEVKGMVLVSPTYEGMTSDIEGIAKVLHEQGIPLLVDEAHGAHFVFHDAFPQSAIELGADLVVQSLHKTLPALTQTGILHLGGDLVRQETVQDYLSIFQSSSPSYILMASIDDTIHRCHEDKDGFDTYVEKLTRVRKELGQLKHLRLLSSDDLGKLVISTRGTSLCGEELFCRIRDDYQLELEMAELTYVIAMTSIEDTEEGFVRLVECLCHIDDEITFREDTTKPYVLTPGELVLSPREAKEREGQWIPLDDAVGRIAQEMICLYPPGIPEVVPGEMMTEEIVAQIKEYLAHEMKVLGTSGMQCKVIQEG